MHTRVLHAHTCQYQKPKSNFKHNLTSKCQSKSVTMTKQFTYDQAKETHRIKDKKVEIIEKIADFFCQILQCDNGCDFFGCFDAIIRCDIFPKKTWDAMRLPSLSSKIFTFQMCKKGLETTKRAQLIVTLFFLTTVEFKFRTKHKTIF